MVDVASRVLVAFDDDCAPVLAAVDDASSVGTMEGPGSMIWRGRLFERCNICRKIGRFRAR
jgi:hypothetical protein